MTLRLYDLAGAQPERRFSPYCWRIRLALAHKSLPVETIPWRFTEKAEIAPSGQTLVPVLVNGDRWIAGSWTIANYLEDTFPDSPSLFGGASGRDLTRYYSSLADSLGAAIFPFVALDIWQHVADKDREYFRASREKRVGKTLEALVADPSRASACIPWQPRAAAPYLAGTTVLRRGAASLCRLCHLRSVPMGPMHQSVSLIGGRRSGQAVARSFTRLL
jgi:glutathione S-transferase